MEFTINRTELLKLIEKVSPALIAGDAFPFYSMILVETFADGITLSTFAGDLQIKTFMQTPVQTNMAFGVNGKLFTDLMKNLTSEIISLSVKDEATLKVKSGRKSLNLNITSADIFPIAPAYENFTFKTVEGLIPTIDTVLYAVSDDDTRLILNSVYVNQTEVVAIDGHRMSITPLPVPIEDQFILPATSLSKLKKTLPGDSLDMCVMDNFIHFREGTTAVSIRPIAKEYPNYRTVIPSGPHDVIKVKKSDLANALKLVTIMADKQQSTTLDFTAEGTLTVSTKNNDTGVLEDRMEADCYKPIKIGFNARYLMDVVKHLKKDIMELEVRGPLSPVIIREDERIHVVMPKKII
jgi:DNA polymerase III subunit beta